MQNNKKIFNKTLLTTKELIHSKSMAKQKKLKKSKKNPQVVQLKSTMALYSKIETMPTKAKMPQRPGAVTPKPFSLPSESEGKPN